MKLPESVIRPVKKICGGIHINHHKNTAECETVAMPAPEKVYLSMSQHIGAPASPCVEKGAEVFVGTLIGETTAAVCSPVYSSVSGTVDDIITKTVGGRPTQFVVISSDGNMTPDPSIKPFEVKSREDLAEAAKKCGLVGLGGAGFPTHIKLSPPADCEIDTLVINGAECEPYITADYRECMENSEDIIEGVYLVKKIMGIKNAVIGIESNKPEAIEKLSKLAAEHKEADGSVKVMCLPSTYPQGAEKVIIYSATGRKLPGGALPSDIGCIVMNITSIATLYRFIKTGMPLVRKRLTVDGSGIAEGKNVFVPLGTPVKNVIDFVGETDEDAERVISGGLMMGAPIGDLETVVEKRNNAILVMRPKRETVTTNCIRCGRCIAGCPMNLAPRDVDAAYSAGLKEQFAELNVNYCMECGSCSYVCPAKRPLTEVMRIAKQELRRKK